MSHILPKNTFDTFIIFSWDVQILSNAQLFKVKVVSYLKSVEN